MAKEFRTSQSAIQHLIKKVENKPEVLQELLEKEKETAVRREEVANKVKEWDAADVFIDSAHSVQKKLLEEDKIHSSIREIRNVMKKQLRMGYKKVTHITMQGNSVRNIVLRQQFALKLVELLMAGKTILNVDESFLGMMDFRLRKWQRRRGAKCHAITQTQPRISVISALDSDGEIFYSLVQGNTNDKIMEIFIQKLVKRLDSIKKEWRKSMVWLFDNA